jgi:hypothetical protein
MSSPDEKHALLFECAVFWLVGGPLGILVSVAPAMSFVWCVYAGHWWWVAAHAVAYVVIVFGIRVPTDHCTDDSFSSFLERGVWRYHDVDVVTLADPSVFDSPALFAGGPHGPYFLEGSLLATALRRASQRVLLSCAVTRWIALWPIIHLIGQWGHCISCERSSILATLKEEHVFILAGGAREACVATFGVDLLVAGGHTGLVRIALQSGRPLVPCVVVGSASLFWRPAWLARLWAPIGIYFGLATPLPVFGVWGIPYVPRRHKLRVVVGAPVDLSDLLAHDAEHLRTGAHRYEVAMERLATEHAMPTTGAELTIINNRTGVRRVVSLPLSSHEE